MAKKTFDDDVYGKITYKEEGYWLLKDGIKFRINNKEIEVKTEVDIYNSLYEKFNMELLSEGLMQFHKKNPQLLNADEAEKIKKEQKEFYKKHLIDDIDKICYNIEEAALRKREELLEDENEESFAEIVGKEKAKRVFEAKTREEKLSSLELKRLKVQKDRIEITCICDWFNPSGGFVIFGDGSAEMFYVDSMSI
ncbi:hypothetical protein [Clostridium beijerinckii]|jgi:hypothetical protein|uniref:Uncharacterized protein n=2 Tax=Clostridium beijerinckii TaxID=1520 RepID=A0A1S8RT08_CLOBE|nr:hypothetical protein [Clostridium beijerinckii]ABR36484.1 hypothetical protein Cbei_4375 [Clostridium beijerinckii NCIMB 8052]AIU05166.1 hypothetical protein Cbs_4375 [Clostridium beijerinckii ATCC 35702]MBF7808866.1 hypothetical protein [Clostridium beijerinckii]NOW89351.1 hypothetical protein [Clostridium beijerinckii]NRT22449.1 hypothetical protein [Clostridium beijerinckii]